MRITNTKAPEHPPSLGSCGGTCRRTPGRCAHSATMDCVGRESLFDVREVKTKSATSSRPWLQKNILSMTRLFDETIELFSGGRVDGDFVA